MDLINNRTRDIMQMSLNGLYERSRAIAANTANAVTPGYKRKEVNFEQSLQQVIKAENEKEQIRIQNMKQYQNVSDLLKGQSIEKLAFLSSDISEQFHIDVEEDMSQGYEIDGNNVNIEKEMMDEAQNGMRYNVVANLLSKSYKQMGDIIKGQNS